MANVRKKSSTVAAVLATRVDGHDEILDEMRDTLKEILATTTKTNLSVAVLPTWNDIRARETEQIAATQAVGTRVTILETTASEQRGSMKVIGVVAGVIGTILAGIFSWVISLF